MGRERDKGTEMRGSLWSKPVNDGEGFSIGGGRRSTERKGERGAISPLFLSWGLFVNQFPVAGS